MLLEMLEIVIKFIAAVLLGVGIGLLLVRAVTVTLSYF